MLWLYHVETSLGHVLLRTKKHHGQYATIVEWERDHLSMIGTHLPKRTRRRHPNFMIFEIYTSQGVQLK